MRTRLLLLSITLLGIAFRLLFLHVGIFLDESVTVFVAQAASFNQLLERIGLYEFNPPLYFILMSCWIDRFGDKAVALTIPGLICGVLQIPAVYLFAGELHRRSNIGLWAAFFTAVSPLACMFAHVVRSYSLLGLLSALFLYFFVKCLRKTSFAHLICLGLLLVLMLYTHYVALYLLVMIFTTALIYSRLPSRSGQFRLLFLLVTLFISVLAYIPWIPFFWKHRTLDLYWVDRTPLLDWPLVFVNNLAASFPFPFVPAAIVLGVVSPVVLLLIIWTARVQQGRRRLAGIASSLLQNKALLFSAVNLLGPAATIGYSTPFIIGYSRYLTPFAIFAWVLWAGSMPALVDFLAGRLSRSGNDKGIAARRIVVLSLVTLIAAADFKEVLFLSDGDRSGLRAFARDWKSGKFADSALLMVPDYDSYTLLYYLKTEQGTELPPPYYFTYPRQNMIVPGQHQGCVEAYQDEKRLESALAWAERLPSAKVPYLVVVRDVDALDSKLMPARTRCDQLLRALAKRFEQAGPPLKYTSKGNSFEVYRFSLAKRS